MRQHMLMVNFNTRFSSKVSLFGNYSLGYAKDLPGSPTDPYNFAQDWGRSNFDRRHNFQLIGNVLAPAGIRVSPFITMRSGQPYDVLAGEDLYGDTMTNARAAFVSTASCAGVVRSGDSVCSPYGTFSSAYSVTNPGNLVPRNYLTMPGLVSVNMRISRTFGFGGSPKKAQANSGMPGMPQRRGHGPVRRRRRWARTRRTGRRWTSRRRHGRPRRRSRNGRHDGRRFHRASV